MEFKECIFNLREKNNIEHIFLISLAHLRFNKLFMAHELKSLRPQLTVFTILVMGMNLHVTREGWIYCFVVLSSTNKTLNLDFYFIDFYTVGAEESPPAAH